MRKLFLKAAICLSAFLLLNSSANAQIQHGPVAGLNFANFSGDDADNTSLLIGFHAGWAVNFNLTENISLQPQLLYSTKGANAEITSTEEVPISLSYIEIPIWGRYNLDGGFHIDFGPYIGFLMNAKIDGEDEIVGTKVKDSYNSMDFGLGIGAGYEMDNGLGFALNYNFGLANAADYPNGSGDDAVIKNSVIKLSLSYTLGKD